jgi:hypothetical protein
LAERARRLIARDLSEALRTKQCGTAEVIVSAALSLEISVYL